MSIKYRPEIDGLRAVSVLMVLFYHADLPFFGKHGFRGGYVGVDIFFVISGYLICANIGRDLAAGTFSFATFYERRMRRILPAAFFVMSACIPIAWMLLFPKPLQEFMGSLAAATSSVSNLFFWQKDSYASAPSAFKPLLHTWTLGVEEQYYLGFPVLLLLIWKKSTKAIFTIFGALFVASLGLAQWGSHAFIDASFFLLPTRIWELLAGAMLAQAELKFDRKAYPRLSAILPSIGLLLILACLSIFNEKTPHPSVITLIPVCGTLLVVWFAGNRDIATRLLSTKYMVGIGLLSYSLYLWHQPIFAFARHLSFQEFDNFDKWMLIALSFALAYGTWRFVEKPFRSRTIIRARIFWPTLIAVALLLLSVGTTGHIYEGFPGRLSPFAMQIYEDSKEVEFAKLRDERGACIYQAADQPCIFGEPNWVLLGDSFAGVFGPSLLKEINKRKQGLMLLVSEQCPFISGVWFGNKPGCELVNQERWKIIETWNKPKVIFLAMDAKQLTRGKIPGSSTSIGEAELIESYQSNIKRVLALGHRVIISHQVPDPGMEVNAGLAYRLLRDSLATELAPLPGSIKEAFELAKGFDRIYEELLEEPNVIHLYPAEIICPLEAGRHVCMAIHKNGPNYNSDEHLSGHGARQVIDDLFAKADTEWASLP